MYYILYEGLKIESNEPVYCTVYIYIYMCVCVFIFIYIFILNIYIYIYALNSI